MALTSTGVGYFLSLPESLHNVCPLMPLTNPADLNLRLGAQAPPGSDGLSAGAIAGITVASVVAGLLLVVTVVVVLKYKSLRSDYAQLCEGPRSARVNVQPGPKV